MYISITLIMDNVADKCKHLAVTFNEDILQENYNVNSIIVPIFLTVNIYWFLTV